MTGVITQLVGSVADLTPGEGKTYVVDGKQIAVFLLTDGTLRAVDAVCPHRGGPLADGQVDTLTLICPLHQYAFSLTDGTCSAPHIDAINTYQAEITGEETISITLAQ
ncbi:Rieske (2Fe-2S) protein [Mycobacteroides franklinii]|uniref:Assimilatory nitrite reductase [NAD(P)H] small subunit n=1 Tax=Mycobacteroides franklinii TaxID=948102 RepID=A0A4R8RBM7_9MYCO|nr:Rieske (2Fe-2S) protein [Mycobacteroides franklinii]ORA58874.1 2Fe-2S ferredoxin [Mycobacteroides franklinii]TDH21135.1 Rieske (2Fe-2S) protein [Mycobacteroides franklinii]TDZ42572.1 Assimilatory nitrite reductase [NAD(P)H] small subunit [Mycobacteroides franklinii]TDZ52720.1 Assimilatory nitrite reductase [NAD(P)H] small subunit [Mycobacteroides franklinii]TDZ56127.1 Assimilatory nitrite reductase [NAD(P)H] small subunit [Mycobacteroides franklinii]